jgi:hypothetical protein
MVNQNGTQKILEDSDIIEADSIEAAVFVLSNRGFMVRDIRVATQDDLHIAKLKKFRDKLSKKPKQMGTTDVEDETITIRQNKLWSWYHKQCIKHPILFLLIVIMIMIYSSYKLIILIPQIWRGE